MSFTFEERRFESDFIEAIWRTYSDAGGSFISTAENHWEIVFTRQNDQTTVTLRGPETVARSAPIPVQAEFFGIIFRYGAYMPQLPVSKLVDGEFDLPEARRNTFWLHSYAWGIPDFEHAEVFIERLVREDLLVSDQLVEDVLQNRPPDLSQRTVQRRFKRATGLTRGQFDQIDRARQAAVMLEQGVSIADAIYYAGYADQPHLTRSLKQFTGQTPGEIVRTINSK